MSSPPVYGPRSLDLCDSKRLPAAFAWQIAGVFARMSLGWPSRSGALRREELPLLFTVPHLPRGHDGACSPASPVPGAGLPPGPHVGPSFVCWAGAAPGSPRWLGLGDPDGPGLIIWLQERCSSPRLPSRLSLSAGCQLSVMAVTVSVSGSEATWLVHPDLSCGVGAAVTARDRQEEDLPVGLAALLSVIVTCQGWLFSFGLFSCLKM